MFDLVELSNDNRKTERERQTDTETATESRPFSSGGA